MDQANSSLAATTEERTRLFMVREALLRLHKELLNAERKRYEQSGGVVANEFEFFRLVTQYPSFAWIAPLTTLIVQIDEKVADRVPVTADAVDELYAETRSVIAAREGSDFQRKYNELLQDVPELVMQHAAVMQVLPPIDDQNQRLEF